MAVSDDREELYQVFAAFFKGMIALSESEGLSELDSEDLTFTQLRTLLLASTGDPLPITQIADHLDKSATATSRSVDRLARLGLIERRASEEDRRVKLVSITEQGRDMVDQYIESRSQLLREFVNRTAPENVQTLLAALRPIVADSFFVDAGGRSFKL